MAWLQVSLVLAPALAACGLRVPMISGRGLGITGGTLDKLESIPGYCVQLSLEEIRECVEKAGCCIAGQTAQICPADRLMYAARDVTSTVGCLGLITSSIISKKAAEGISSLVLDIKWGVGCYQASLAQAQEMAVALQQTSASLGLATTAVISHMQSPLGRAVGNSLEVGEALDCLHGRGARDLRELVCVEAGMVLVSAGRVDTLDRAKQTVEAVLDSGAALAKFETMLVCQGVEHGLAARLCHQGGVLPSAAQRTPLTVPAAGLVQTV